MNCIQTRQERREKRLRKKRERMHKHGRDLARIYRDAVIKRMRTAAGQKDLNK